MKTSLSISFAVMTVLAVLAFALGFHWTVNRYYVYEGQSLLLRYKGPLLPFVPRTEAKAGFYAEEGEVGVLKEMRGPGRHFYCPIWWERQSVPDIVIKPGEVGIVTSKLGDPLPEGEFIVDGDLDETAYKGILRKAFGPGRYRVNPYAYEFTIINTQIKQLGNQQKHSGWVEIPTGYVGVVTHLADDNVSGTKRGIQQEVYPPGIYPVNPQAMQVDVIEIGYTETSIATDTTRDKEGNIVTDESGEWLPLGDTGISFPSNDGFKIQMDFTAVWGVMPDQAADVVRTFGNIDAVEQKVIIPQSESICRNNGSKMGARELLVGDSRQRFQDATSEEFKSVLKDKHVTLLYGLVRHIFIPQEVRIPIQNGYIADELKLTREQEGVTARTEALLREAEQQVELMSETVRVETAKMVAEVKAEGDKEAKEIAAETQRQVATIDRQAAELNAKKTVVLGQARAEAEKLTQEAQAKKFQLAVEAFGSGQAFTKWQFAEGIPDEMDLNLFYAGEGTLWTDLQNVVPTLPVRQGDGAATTRPPAAVGPSR
ncbi:MAG: SPFH domain-containing protein [Pirellulales bacterium]|nr:band 7 protein [Planctomycetales bacterium]